MNKRRILFICEGDCDEPDFIKTMLKKSFPQIEYEIYSYQTTIHILAAKLKDSYPDFDNGDYDIALILRDLEENPEEKRKLSNIYSDIIISFDAEMQHTDPDFKIINRMLAYFTDSTDMGKLYLNYPMMQSYKHVLSINDEKYIIRTASPSGYKELVDKESCIKDLRKYTYETFARIAVMNLQKAWNLLSNKNNLPTAEDYIKIDWNDILDIETYFYNQTNEVYVLNTICLFIVDYSPEQFIRMISRHPSKYKN